MPKDKLDDDHIYTIWDRWDIKDCAEKTLQDILDWIVSEHKLYPRDVLLGAKPLYMTSMGDTNGVLKEKLKDLIGFEKGEHCDLTITLSLQEKGGEICQGTPGVRIHY